MSAHADRKAAEHAQLLNGDDFRWPLYHECPEAWDRLNIFQWEWMSDLDPNVREWVRAKGKPISQERGVNPSGLLEACEEVAGVVQRKLHESASPLDMRAAVELWHFRLGYLNPLNYLGGQRLAKNVEARAAPNGQPLAICIGSNKRERVTSVRDGKTMQVTMQGYAGCLRTFPDLPFGPGRRWPRLCAACEPQRSNARNKEISELRRRVARSAATR